MVKVNNRDIEWEDMPEGFYLTDVKRHVLWTDEKTGAHFALVKFPKGGVHELPHIHPDANHWMFGISGEVEYPGGVHLSAPETYMFAFRPKGKLHGPQPGTQFLTDCIAFVYFDGPHTRVFK